MRIGVISDVHGNLIALEQVLLDVKTRSPDLVVNLGDLVSSPLWPAETLALIRAEGHATVRGNHDRWLASLPLEKQTRTNQYVYGQLSERARSELGALPLTCAFEGGVLAVHGTPYSDMDYLLEDALDGRLARATTSSLADRLGGIAATLVLCGHSHTQSVVTTRDGVMVVNPGSVGCPRSVDQRTPWQTEACSPHARYAVVTKSPQGWRAELFVLAYDWSQVVRRAAANGRDDWGRAFLGSAP